MLKNVSNKSKAMFYFKEPCLIQSNMLNLFNSLLYSFRHPSPLRIAKHAGVGFYIRFHHRWWRLSKAGGLSHWKSYIMWPTPRESSPVQGKFWSLGEDWRNRCRWRSDRVYDERWRWFHGWREGNGCGMEEVDPLSVMRNTLPARTSSDCTRAVACLCASDWERKRKERGRTRTSLRCISASWKWNSSHIKCRARHLCGVPSPTRTMNIFF